MSYKPGICTFCGNGCGHFLRVNDGKVDGVFASRNHPVSQGRLCVRGWNIHELLSTNQRLYSPMIRKNGTLEKATYDEAIGLAMQKLVKYAADSPDSVAVLASPRSSNEENYLLMKLARAVIKTNNISLDSESGHRSSMDVLAAGTGMPGMLGSVAGIMKAELILVFDIDITKQNPILGSEIHKARRAGATLVTVDSRKTQMAKLSDHFLQSKPGSNKALLAAIAKIIIDENLMDSDYIQKYTTGFEGFANQLGSINYDDIAAKTGVSVDDIRVIARKLAAAKTAMAFYPSGISGLDADMIGVLFNLFLFTGKIGKEGSGVNPVTGLSNLQGGYDMGAAPDLLTGYQSLADEAALKKFADAWGVKLTAKKGKAFTEMMEDASAKPRALLIVDHDEGIVRYADEIKKAELVVYIGAFENPFTEFAHIVLPVASYIEADGTYTNTERRIQLSERKAEPAAGVLPGWKLMAAMAEKGGAKWGYGSAEDVMKEIAKLTPSYSKVTYAGLKKAFGIQWPCDEKSPNGTPHFDLEKRQKSLYFVKVSGDYAVPATTREYTHNLMVGKAQHYWHQNNLMKITKIPLREYNATLLMYPQGFIEISAADAKTLQVRDKWPVKVTSPGGTMNVAVKVSDEVGDGTAYVPYFVQDMISKFLIEHREELKHGEDATIPVRIEKV